MADFGPGYGPLILSALGSVIPRNRIFPQTAPDKLEKGSPFVIFTGVGGLLHYYREGALADKGNQRVQFDIFATSAQQAYQVTRDILAVVVGHERMEPLTQPLDNYETTLKLYGYRFDAAVWFDNY